MAFLKPFLLMDREGNYALITCLPPLVGGRGTTKWWRGTAEGGLIKLAAKPPPPPLGLKGRQTYKPSGPTGRSILRTFPSEPSEPGLRSGPSSRPLPSRCARHPPPGRGWAGNMEERNVASNPAYPILWGGKRRPRPSNLPPTARRGEGDHEVVEGAAEGGLIKLAAKPPPPPSEPGPRSGPSSRPLPSRCARHPPPGRGWAGNMEERNVASNPAYPILWGGKRRPRPSNLPPTARRGEGDHEVVEGAAEGGLIKLAAKPPPPPSA